MKNIISKELFAEVMNMPISRNVNEQGVTRIIGLNKSEVDNSLDLDFGYQELESSHGRYINFYYFISMMEDWAIHKMGYRFVVSYDEINCYCEIYKALDYKLHEIGELVHVLNEQCHKTDIIIKACQWILDNKA